MNINRISRVVISIIFSGYFFTSFASLFWLELISILAGLLSPPAVLPLALIGKFASSIVFLTVYLYTAEIYPTQVRGMGLALTATMARYFMIFYT